MKTIADFVEPKQEKWSGSINSKTLVEFIIEWAVANGTRHGAWEGKEFHIEKGAEGAINIGLDAVSDSYSNTIGLHAIMHIVDLFNMKHSSGVESIVFTCSGTEVNGKLCWFRLVIVDPPKFIETFS